MDLREKMKVRKKSNKPFRSGDKINTVRDVLYNPSYLSDIKFARYLQGRKNRIFYSFYEDNSIVEIKKCIIVE